MQNEMLQFLISRDLTEKHF